LARTNPPTSSVTNPSAGNRPLSHHSNKSVMFASKHGRQRAPFHPLVSLQPIDERRRLRVRVRPTPAGTHHEQPARVERLGE
jgi:hypothetical protein